MLAVQAALRKRMQEPINRNQTARRPPRIRSSVWLIVCGSLLTCLLMVSVSRRQAGSSAVQPESASERTALDGSTPAPASTRPTHRTGPEAKLSEVPAQSTRTEASAAISNELSAAMEKLGALRGNYGEEHPEVKGQVRAIESLERSALTSGETLDLAKARAELAKLQVRFGPEHPDLQAQRRFVESMEQSAAASEPPDLAQAKAQLAKLRVFYGEGHSEVQAQLKRVAELQQ
jgi:hypothetical protein